MTSKIPNILLIITDQQRTDTLGFMGKTLCRTPNMDRLAQEGISFDRALTPSPLCQPARASLFTGYYPHQVDMMTNDGTLIDEPILFSTLKERGYHLNYVGKWHLGQEGENISTWFDRAICYRHKYTDYQDWLEENELPNEWALNDDRVMTQRTPRMSIPNTVPMQLDPSQTHEAWVTDHVIEYLETRPADQPFYLVCSYFGPHPPFKIPEPYYSMYDPANIPEPPNFKPSPNKPISNARSFYHLLWLDHGGDWEVWKKTVAVYWGFVTMIDDQIGRILQTLEDQGVVDDTLIVFVSDHGEFLGQHGLWHKMMPYEEPLRVPLLMRYPALIKPGLRSQVNASLVDITPTIFSIVSEDVPESLAGQDLSPAFQDCASFLGDGYRFSEHKPLGDWHQTVEWRLVTDNRFKYVWNQGDLDELYDLEADPYELINLIAHPDYADELARLKERLFRWMVETADPILWPF